MRRIPVMWRSWRLLMRLAVVVPLMAAWTCAQAHPLDALSAQEITKTIEILKNAGHVNSETRYPAIRLIEPTKEQVLKWLPGKDPDRRAFVTMIGPKGVHEATVNVTASKVEAWAPVKGVQPAILLAEWQAAQKIVLEDSGFLAALKGRGYDQVKTIGCAPLTAGYFGDETQRETRLLRVTCFDRAKAKTNLWGNPIEGLHALVDLGTAKVLEVIDTGKVPVSEDSNSYDYASSAKYRGGMRPVEQSAPDGSNIKLQGDPAGWQIAWDNWSMHLRVDKRLGHILSLVSFDDAGKRRLIAYQMSASEMFVPYMDADKNWYYRSYMDIGEYGLGVLASPLKPGSDCPANATFLDPVLPGEDGNPTQPKSIVCIFERATGDPIWRHAEFINETHESRPAIELVVRMIPTVGNYDYVMDYVFRQSGEIDVRVGATGIDAVKGVKTAKMSDATAAADTETGTLIAPNLVGVYHDHLISFRLDLDVDGQDNRLVKSALTPVQFSGGLRRGGWAVKDETITTEGPIAVGAHDAPSMFRVISASRRNGLGQSTGYELHAGHSTISSLPPADWPQRRAAFSGAPLWVTPFDPKQIFAAGEYPNQSDGSQGLPAYVSKGRPVDGTDLVLWYTLGFKHVTRPEDWPVLPTRWHSFTLRPFSFFNRNPALDIRIQDKKPAKTEEKSDVKK